MSDEERQSVSVMVSVLDIQSAMYPEMLEVWLMDKLRAYGVPVVGSSLFCGVERGRLSVEKTDTHFVYRWVE